MGGCLSCEDGKDGPVHDVSITKHIPDNNRQIEEPPNPLRPQRHLNKSISKKPEFIRDNERFKVLELSATSESHDSD